ncbi:N-acetylglucosamine-6-phosphate deacetylase [Thermocladium modestius]|uniref:N-acetylglucosamine-6-phosphate deacetylase n=1 Tax=Thermocladium modestius TaxID=62609 RepID=A0A830GUP7_9CREN|nr:N-acetylglucosamine-6-phosphate deacetylase [Thermocladium modestius]GGP19603.1 N-acetylglucosamine-6-phosphate deacetylase [Thermocladium modestius]
MAEKVVRVDTIYTPYQSIHDVSIIIHRGVIAEVRDAGGMPSDVDLRGLSIAPGYIDTHIHGCCGFDVTRSASVKELNEISVNLARFGVTSFVPTLVSARHENILRVLGLIISGRRELRGAKAVGIGLEGPYINPERRGAQNPEVIRVPNLDELKQYLALAGDMPLLVHVAPELKGAMELIQYAVSQGVVVSVGHTNADYETTTRAVALGASRATHLFDAMKGIHHRDPGTVMALMDNENVYLELIVDLIHLRPEAVLFAVRYAGSHRIVLVTDAIAAAGLGDGEYELGGLRVTVANGRATLPDGTLAGSTLTLDRAVRNMISLGIKPTTAISMATAVPALSLGLREVGCLRPGCAADFVALDDKYRVVRSFINGENVYSAT